MRCRCALRRVLLPAWIVCFGSLALQAEQPTIDFNRQIRPILSDRCFACHGPDPGQRQGGFRLDQKESALGEADSGERPIVPGDPDASEMIARLTSEDEFMQMPPAESGKAVTAEEIELIRRWIAQGAAWREHWSLVAPQRPELPAVQQQQWPRNEIDRFILAQLEQEGLRPQHEADKATLVRRATFDLTGLPPTPAEVDAFLADDSPEAYARLIDRLLQSPHYGQHMARFWLDAVRYGDTHGLHLDNYREMWPYRDWVVDAFNQNMPYDRFTVEQLAGDLLPEPTLGQLIATGFNRCHVTTNEGGSIAEEVQVRNVVDRVVTTGTVFMGLTFDCTRCHDHKYDPLTARDFYSMYAFFNSLEGNPLDGNIKDHAPVVRVLTDPQQSQLSDLQAKVASLQAEISSRLASYEYSEPAEPAAPKPAEVQEFVWLEDDLPEGAKAEGGWQFVESPVFSGKRASQRTAEGLSQHFFTGASRPLRIGEGDVLFTYVYLDPTNPPREIMLQWNDGSWDHRAYWGENLIDWGQDASPSRQPMGSLPEVGQWVRLEVPAQHVGLKAASQVNGWAFTQFGGTVTWDRAGLVSRTEQKRVYDSLALWLQDQRSAADAGLSASIKALLQIDPDQRTEDQRQQLHAYFLEHVYVGSREIFAPLHQQLEEAREQIKQIEQSGPTTLVFRERKEPLPAYILHRGEYDQQREQVHRATPPILPPLPEGAPQDRLGLAQWLIAPEHPLTARVAVNRFWMQVFGTGLVKTAEDFGSQGEPPSHPELLDWLAIHFRESGWDVKGMMKQIVMSATYRQSSQTTPELLRRDPANRLLARGPRFRLDAESLRDQALAVSGLLIDRQGGPSVKPPQPDLWFAVGYSGSNTVRFTPDEGPDKVHRRTLYTFIKRTAPPPQLSTFDAPSREACTVRRERTNTPLQALLLMNDPQYFEPARALAQRAMREAESPQATADTMFRLCTARQPRPAEAAELLALYQDHLQQFQSDEPAARLLLAVGSSPPDESLDAAQSAAWTIVANTILNLDEVLTKN